MIGEIVYGLCTLLSLACALLLLRSYRRNGVRLLLWSGLCFIGLCVNNALLFADIIVLPQYNLSVARTIPAILALSLLCYGLIWDAS